MREDEGVDKEEIRTVRRGTGGHVPGEPRGRPLRDRLLRGGRTAADAGEPRQRRHPCRGRTVDRKPGGGGLHRHRHRRIPDRRRLRGLPALGTTLPTGRDVVVSRTTFEPISEHLEVYLTNGALLAEIGVKSSDYPQYSWLYGLDGTFLVVGDGTSLEVIGNDGTPLRPLDAPAAMCDPVRWWDDTTILATCVPDAIAATSGYYHVLWLIPVDGSAPTRLTVDPDPDVNVVEFGHANAWRVEGPHPAAVVWRTPGPAPSRCSTRTAPRSSSTSA